MTNTLSSSHTYAAPGTPEFFGAKTLQYCLVKSLRNSQKKHRLLKSIVFWQNAINGMYKKTDLTDGEKMASHNIHTWYKKEYRRHAYKVKNWQNSPRKNNILQDFRNDPHYYFKNLVEVVARSLIDEIFRADGLDVKVYLTSAHDNSFSGVDFILENNAKLTDRYSGIDLTISEYDLYIKKKSERKHVTCSEFNTLKRLGDTIISREVFAIPPSVMTKFLSGYMEIIASHGAIESSEMLSLFHEAKTQTVATVCETVQSRVEGAMHSYP